MQKEVPLTKSQEWSQLVSHFSSVLKSFNLKEAFKADPERFRKFNRVIDLKDGEEILVDFSKNLITEETFKLLMSLAVNRRIAERIDNMFSGHFINFTENRQVLHTALRGCENGRYVVMDKDIGNDIAKGQVKVEIFAESIRSGQFKGYSGKPLKTIVNIGIGGSDLGPCMVVEALKAYIPSDMRFYFVSNIDGTHMSEVLKQCDYETTLFIVVSKTFTTIETLVNASTAKEWLLKHFLDEEAVANHFIAISTNYQKAIEFGIDENNVFVFWDWVGGRYSLWSAVGMSIVLAIGKDNFRQLLHGANLMDKHFKTELPENNIPIILGMIGILYNNFFGYSTHAILPYEQYLWKLPAYLQQADMESNGKFVNSENEEVDYSTGPIIWGQPGTNGQHAFYQLIHQGTKVVPADFLVGVNSHNPISDNAHQKILLANFLAQTEALCSGKTFEDVKAELSASCSEAVMKHRVFKGNRPTNSIVYTKLTPKVLGALIAMYEHKIFVQGAIWGINSFDQWGVELGKQLALKVQNELEENAEVGEHDNSTLGLLSYIKQKRAN